MTQIKQQSALWSQLSRIFPHHPSTSKQDFPTPYVNSCRKPSTHNNAVKTQKMPAANPGLRMFRPRLVSLLHPEVASETWQKAAIFSTLPIDDWGDHAAGTMQSDGTEKQRHSISGYRMIVTAGYPNLRAHLQRDLLQRRK